MSARKPRKTPVGHEPDYASLNIRDWLLTHGIDPDTKDFTHTFFCPFHPSTGATLTAQAAKPPIFACPECGDDKNFKDLLAKWPDAAQFCTVFLAKRPGEIVEGDEYTGDYSYIALGFEANGPFWYQALPNGHIRAITSDKHSERNFYSIIPDQDYWRSKYYNRITRKFDWGRAGAEMMKACQLRGYFNPEKIRGVGLWWDEDKIVVNLGNRIMVDGVETPLHNATGDFFYDQSKGIDLPEPLTDEALQEMYPLMARFPFTKPSDAVVATGILICGIMPCLLKWRPHGWISGESGSGKSQIVQHTFTAIWKHFGGVILEGTATAAGARQAIHNNACSVTIDDMEMSNMAHDFKRIHEFIVLCRIASSKSDARDAKGSHDGTGAKYYQSKFCAVATSIIDPIEQPQDKSRWFHIEARKSEESKRGWKQLEKDLLAYFNKTTAHGLLARVIQDARHILDTIETFTNALVENANSIGWGAGGRRHCDQWGAAMGAAWWTMHPAEELTEEAAMAFFCQYYDKEVFEQQIAPEAGKGFGNMAVKKMLEHQPIGEKFTIADMVNDMSIRGGRYENGELLLRRFGLRVEGGCLWVAIGHNQVKKIMEGNGILNYSYALTTIDGARRVDKLTQFNTACSGRVEIPLTAIGVGVAEETDGVAEAPPAPKVPQQTAIPLGPDDEPLPF